MTDWNKTMMAAALTMTLAAGGWAADGDIFAGGELKAKINNAAVVGDSPDGKGKAIVWNKAEKKAALVMGPELSDWSTYDTLSFKVYSPRAGEDAFMLVVNSDPADKKGKGNYFFKMIKVDWTGWKDMEIPFSQFGKSRTPVGWNQIDNITFNSFGWGLTPKPGMALSIAEVKVVKKN